MFFFFFPAFYMKMELNFLAWRIPKKRKICIWKKMNAHSYITTETTKPSVKVSKEWKFFGRSKRAAVMAFLLTSRRRRATHTSILFSGKSFPRQNCLGGVKKERNNFSWLERFFFSWRRLWKKNRSDIAELFRGIIFP